MKENPAVTGKVDIKVIGLGAALLVALGGVYYSWQKTNQPLRASAPVSADQSRAVQDGEVDALLASVESRLQQDAVAIETDWPSAAAPVQVKVSAVKSESVLKLRGVVGGAQPMAFINDSTVGLGESIEGFTVESIESESVTVVDERGRKQVLPLYEHE